MDQWVAKLWSLCSLTPRQNKFAELTKKHHSILNFCTIMSTNSTISLLTNPSTALSSNSNPDWDAISNLVKLSTAGSSISAKPNPSSTREKLNNYKFHGLEESSFWFGFAIEDGSFSVGSKQKERILYMNKTAIMMYRITENKEGHPNITF